MKPKWPKKLGFKIGISTLQKPKKKGELTFFLIDFFWLGMVAFLPIWACLCACFRFQFFSEIKFCKIIELIEIWLICNTFYYLQFLCWYSHIYEQKPSQKKMPSQEAQKMGIFLAWLNLDYFNFFAKINEYPLHGYKKSSHKKKISYQTSFKHVFQLFA